MEKEIINLAREIIKYRKAGWYDYVRKLQVKLMCKYFPKMTHEEMLIVNEALTP